MSHECGSGSCIAVDTLGIHNLEMQQLSIAYSVCQYKSSSRRVMLRSLVYYQTASLHFCGVISCVRLPEPKLHPTTTSCLALQVLHYSVWAKANGKRGHHGCRRGPKGDQKGTWPCREGPFDDNEVIHLFVPPLPLLNMTCSPLSVRFCCRTLLSVRCLWRKGLDLEHQQRSCGWH